MCVVRLCLSFVFVCANVLIDIDGEQGECTCVLCDARSCNCLSKNPMSTRFRASESSDLRVVASLSLALLLCAVRADFNATAFTRTTLPLPIQPYIVASDAESRMQVLSEVVVVGVVQFDRCVTESGVSW